MRLAAELRAMHLHAYHIHPPGLLLPVGRYPHLLTREMICMFGGYVIRNPTLMLRQLLAS